MKGEFFMGQIKKLLNRKPSKHSKYAEIEIRDTGFGIEKQHIIKSLIVFTRSRIQKIKI